MDTELVAYLDESRKPMRNPATGRVDHRFHHYVVAAVVILDGESADIRHRLGRIGGRFGYPLHYRSLGPGSRIGALEGIEEINGWDGYIFETARALPDAHFKEHHVRAKIMEAAFVRLCSEGIMRAVLETRSAPMQGFTLDQKDHQVLNRLQRQKSVLAGFRISHADKTEAILQLPDLLAGSRSDWLCSVDRNPYARVSHRVLAPTPLFARQGL